MINLVNNEDVEQWAKETPRKRFGIPYSFKEVISWLKNNAFGPSKKFKDLTEFIPQKCTQNSISSKLRLGFLGDIMNMKEKKLEIGSKVKEFFKNCDYVIGNFEGTIIKEYNGKKILMTAKHNENILLDLESLFPPEKFILMNANNHSGDFGWTKFNESYKLLKDHGFLAIGRRDEPSILLEEQVRLVNCTRWSNQPDTPYVIRLEEVENYFDEAAAFNILSPHWGYEMQLYPNQFWIEEGKQLLEKWGMLIGHHSHCPQPVASYAVNNVNKVLAYSLGNFCFDYSMEKYHFSIILKTEIGPDKNMQWKVGNLEWKFTELVEIDKSISEVQLKDTCPYFKDNVE